MTSQRPALGWSDLRGTSVGLWGLGKEGHASLRKLRALGIEPVLVDDAPREQEQGVLKTAGGGLDALKQTEIVIKTPGISPYTAEADELRRSGVTLVGGLGLWMNEAEPAKVVYVTGTKGKSTTSSIIGHLLRGLGRKTLVGGNFGAAPYDPEHDEDYDSYESDEIPAPRRARRWPRVLLAFGFVVLGAAIVGGAVAIVGSATHGFKKPVKVVYKKSPVFSLKTGDCFDPQGQSYTLVSCDSPHVAEVFGTFTLTGTKWPGDAALQAAASSGCTSRLTSYLNPQLAISLASTYVYPDSVAWRAGTRTVICEVRASSGELTGSVRGASATAG